MYALLFFRSYATIVLEGKSLAFLQNKVGAAYHWFSVQHIISYVLLAC